MCVPPKEEDPESTARVPIGDDFRDTPINADKGHKRYANSRMSIEWRVESVQRFRAERREFLRKISR